VGKVLAYNIWRERRAKALTNRWKSFRIDFRATRLWVGAQNLRKKQRK